MDENNRVGSISHWANTVYERLTNVQLTSDEHVLLGRIRREKIAASLAAIEREKEEIAKHNDARHARVRIEQHEKVIETELAWLNEHGFPARLDAGSLVVEGLDEAE